MQMSKIEGLIRKWADDRGLIAATTTGRQFDKLEEELEELREALMDQEPLKFVMEEMGDMLVVLINIAYKLGVTMEDCVRMAYEKIKDRKGRIIDGTFVKDA